MIKIKAKIKSINRTPLYNVFTQLYSPVGHRWPSMSHKHTIHCTYHSSYTPPWPSVHVQVCVLVYMTVQLLALSSLRVGADSRGVACEVTGSRGWLDMRLRVRREELLLRLGAGPRLTDTRVVTWKTSRTLFTHMRDEHSTYATAPSSRARRLP